MRSATILVVLLACATGYQQSYVDHSLGGDRHSIDVQVNGHTSAGAALEYAHRRAGELCPAGYDVIDGTKSSRNAYVATGNTVAEISKPEVALIVECRTQSERQGAEPHGEAPEQHAQEIPVVDEQQAPRERRIVYGDNPLWCAVHSTKPTSGNCERTKEACEAVRAQASAGSGDLVECAVTEAASCFNYEDILSGSRLAMCTPSISDCETQLAWHKVHSTNDWQIAATQCGIYRVKAKAGSGGQ